MTLLLQFIDEPRKTRPLPACSRAAQGLPAATWEFSYLGDSAAPIAGRLGES
jgi:hypothetical protein